MKIRSALVEHPFGTLKQWCGRMHFLLRGLAKVRAEMNLLMLSYNFKRVLNIIGIEAFSGVLPPEKGRQRRQFDPILSFCPPNMGNQHLL